MDDYEEEIELVPLDTEEDIDKFLEDIGED